VKTLSIVSLALGVFALTSIATTAKDFTGPVSSIFGQTTSSAHGCMVSITSVGVSIHPDSSDRLSPQRIHELATVDGGELAA
jgi:hypothetical protein